ncbi:MAG: hypothetical protein M1553_06360 [Firmicutes bacterium]|nr:hypothetical protein [Bacillota bacterium]
MKIAAVVANDGDTIVPLPDGPEVIIYDSETDRVERFENPARKVETKRRATVVAFLAEKGVELICSVPQSLCSFSQGQAQEKGLRFLRLAAETRFSKVTAEPEQYQRQAVTELPAMDLYIPPQ